MTIDGVDQPGSRGLQYADLERSDSLRTIAWQDAAHREDAILFVPPAAGRPAAAQRVVDTDALWAGPIVEGGAEVIVGLERPRTSRAAIVVYRLSLDGTRWTPTRIPVPQATSAGAQGAPTT